MVIEAREKEQFCWDCIFFTLFFKGPQTNMCVWCSIFGAAAPHLYLAIGCFQSCYMHMWPYRRFSCWMHHSNAILSFQSASSFGIIKIGAVIRKIGIFHAVTLTTQSRAHTFKNIYFTFHFSCLNEVPLRHHILEKFLYVHLLQTETVK